MISGREREDDNKGRQGGEGIQGTRTGALSQADIDLEEPGWLSESCHSSSAGEEQESQGLAQEGVAVSHESSNGGGKA